MNMAAQPFWLVILGLGITGSIVGAITSAIASALNDRSRRRFELRKWRAEFYLRPKLEALRNLHAALVHSHYEINMRAKARMPQDITEFEEKVRHWETEFFYALTTAEIYLDEETDGNMR